ncbi:MULTISPECIES: DUF6634 family protein [unclassified Mesorhizobium]|uniref:DUF6634 family protein n=1 Tax=unclassified Mesorhizobium TaxID=325217 RepID=UPI00112BF5B7|nr:MULTISPECIES: DUF6634 family protein [unclassified Mesorhizobium]MCA0058512.1 hypothetical protein [Mesorhizobium sp. B261B1A]TPL06264.1 hypothetical protein FJ944_23500 [Mesorhizobium sp. B2-4-11]
MLLFGRATPTDEMLTFQVDRLLALAADLEHVRCGVPPEVMAGEAAPIIDRWILAQRIVPGLAGLSTGHPRLVGQDRLIATTDLWLLSEDRAWARTLSRWYRLGRPAEQSGLDS